MKLKALEFKNGVFLAPMAGVTDIAFRGLCKQMGCDLVYTEMVSAKALYYGNENTESLLRIADEEKPVAIQLFGNDPYVMAKAAERFNDREDICIIDINMGCPAPKIVKNGEGSALMKDPQLAAEIVKEMKKATEKPVTVKIRKGFSREEVTAVEFALRMQDAGADAVAVHGRTREQMYEGKADWNIISDVKKSLTVPVIGNGDIFSYEAAIRMKEITNCDGIMVARGAMGNPWLFREIVMALDGKVVSYPTDDERIDMSIAHYKLSLKYDGEYKAVREMRKHIAWYLKGMKNSTDIKNSINMEPCSEKVIEMLQNYKLRLKEYY